MTELIPFAFEEHLVRVVPRGDEPWFVGADVCRAIEIRNAPHAISRLDADEKEADVAISDGSSTKYATIISEPGVYRLVFRSRKPEAERFKRWLAHDVLPQLRKTGSYTPEQHAAGPDPATEQLIHRLSVVREARLLFGHERARGLWRVIGLPEVPPAPPGPIDEARICLRHLLDAGAHDELGPTVRQLLEAALDDDEDARVQLVATGVRPMAELDGFVVANRHLGLERIFQGTDWAKQGHVRPLRRLVGAAASGQHKYGRLNSRGTFLPALLLDEDV